MYVGIYKGLGQINGIGPSYGDMMLGQPLTTQVDSRGHIHLSGRIGSKTISFHVYISIPDLTTRIQTIMQKLRRLPPGHVDVLDPFFIVNRLPGGRETGGGYFRPDAVGIWLGKERTTEVPDTDINSYVLSQNNSGMIAITKNAFVKPIFLFSVFHELAHSVDTHLRIVSPNSRVEDFRGVRYPLPRVGEYAAEAYARFILATGRICREGSIPSGENYSTCNHRLINMLMRAPAFRGIPADWRPPA